jgi:hypothetical protein
MSNLTDSEQIKLLQELYDTTRTKIENAVAAAFKKCGLIETPANVAEIRKYVDERRKKEKIDGWRFIQSLAVDIAKKIDKFNGA